GIASSGRNESEQVKGGSGSVWRKRGNGYGGDEPLLVPADGEQVHDAAAEPVPDAVLGRAGDTGAMVHGDFNDARAGGVGEHGHKAMKAVEGKQGVEDGAFEGAQAAAGVAEIHAEHRAPGLAG